MATPRTFRVYMMGYEPPGVDMDAVARAGGIDAMMEGCDFCFTRGEGEGVDIGEVLTVTQHFGVVNGPPGLGTQLRCIGLEHHGKIARVEEILQG